MNRRYASPDGSLILKTEETGDDVAIGFEGLPWHTHLDVISQQYNLCKSIALDEYIRMIFRGDLVVCVLKKAGKTIDIWISDYPEKENKYLEPDELVIIRRWL